MGTKRKAAETADWFEDDRFWEGMSGVLFNDDRFANAAGEIDQVRRLLPDVAPGAAVLDLACGEGRHALELARRGDPVTAVDRTRAYLDAARERAAADGLGLEFVHSDMRRFVRPAAFDAAVCLWASFGYFDDPADDRRVLANLLRSLKPGGSLVLDLNGKEVFARTFTPRSWYEQDGVIVLEERRIVGDWSQVSSRWIRIDPGPGGAAGTAARTGGASRREWSFTIRLYSAMELTALLRDVGFAGVRVYGGLDGSPYDHAARRLVAVATKAAAATKRATRRGTGGRRAAAPVG